MSRVQNAQFVAEHRVPHEVIAHILTYLQLSVTTLLRWQQTSTPFYAAAEKYWEVLWNSNHPLTPLKKNHRFACIQVYMHNKQNKTNGTEISVLVDGQSTAGKSSLVVRFREGGFYESHDRIPENTYRTQIHVDGEIVHLKVVDEIGPNEYESVLEHCIKSANGIVICCDVSKKNSIDEIETRIQRIVRVKSLDLQRIPVVIAVTKADIESSEHETTIDQIREFANSQKIKYVITSARFGTNVNELFETISSMSSDVLLRNLEWVEKLENGEPISKKEKKKCTLM